MFDRMINLFTDESVSGVYVSAYILALAKETGAGVTVWRGNQEELNDAIGMLAYAAGLTTMLGRELPERQVFVYGLDPSECAGLALMREEDPRVTVQIVEADVPVGLLVRIKAALSFCCPDDLAAMCANLFCVASGG